MPSPSDGSSEWCGFAARHSPFEFSALRYRNANRNETKKKAVPPSSTARRGGDPPLKLERLHDRGDGHSQSPPPPARPAEDRDRQAPSTPYSYGPAVITGISAKF